MRNNVRHYREQRYLTQGELGAMVGVQAQTIGNIENRKHQPRVKTIRKLAEALGIPVSELFPVSSDEENPVVPAA